ncbi:TRAP transporter substrate-binding protein [Algihabitans sp.]|uniref:TRAP transporter substrate-binding protein n=1 Tax=Algihabitans sp. TaxID=2821514 RepID=UPI003BAAC789
MDRRQFVSAAGAIPTAGSLISLSKPAIARSTIRWQMVSRWPEEFPDQMASGRRLAERIDQMSGGRLSVEVLGPRDLGDYRDTFDKVASGEIAMSRSLSYDWRDRGLAFEMFTVVPLGMTETERTIWIQDLGGQALWDDLFGAFGVKPFLAGSLGPQSFGWFGEPIRSLDDLRGLRYRTTGINVPIMRELGVSPVSMSRSEIGPSFEAGDLDAFELVGPAVDLAYDLHLFLPHYIFPSFHQTAGSIQLIVNRELYEGLPGDLQAIVANAAQAEHLANLTRVHASNIAALRVLREQHSVTIGTVPDDVLTRIGEVASNILSASRDEATSEHQRVFDSFIDARARIREWIELSEGNFMRSRALPFNYPSAG